MPLDCSDYNGAPVKMVSSPTSLQTPVESETLEGATKERHYGSWKGARCASSNDILASNIITAPTELLNVSGMFVLCRHKAFISQKFCKMQFLPLI